MFEPSAVARLARLAHAATEGGASGSTIYAMGATRKRYVVGGIATRIYPVGESRARLRDGMRSMLASYGGAVASTLGYWEDEGSVYVDLGDMHDDLCDALRIAESRGELAIFDTWTRDVTYVTHPADSRTHVCDPSHGWPCSAVAAARG